MRRVAIISPYFPPSTLAGVHRARLLAKHLPAAGWEPVIICADPADYEERPDPDLATLVPAEAKVIRVRAASAALSRRFGVGDLGIRAYGALKRAMTELEELDAQQADLFGMRFLLGCTAEETAELTGLSKATVDRRVKVARAWLFQRITGVKADAGAGEDNA